MNLARWAVAAFVVGLAMTNVWWISQQQFADSAVWERKIQRAERILYYPTTPDQGPSFEMRGDERTLSLITHSVFKSEEYDPRRVTRYAVELTLEDATGAQRWQREIHIRTRQSKRGREGRFWRDENSFVRHRRVQITDDRLTRVELPDELGKDWRLTIRGRGPVDEVLVRAYTQRERTRIESLRRGLAMGPDELRLRARRTGLGDWGHLSDDERIATNRARWDRMSAAGERDVDYRTRVVYYSGFRLPLETAALESGLELNPGFPLVTNVRGGTAVHVRATTTRPGAVLSVSSVSTESTPRPREFSADDEGTIDEVFFLPAGLHSLRWSTEGAAFDLDVEALAGGDAQFGKYAQERFLTGGLRPDWRRVVAARLGPDTAAVRLPVPDTLHDARRRLRVSLRPIVDVGMVQAPPTSATVVTLDAQGEELSREVLELERDIARFDRFESDEHSSALGARTQFDLVPAPAATTVELTADRSIAVLGYHHVPDDEPEQLDRPYRDVAPDAVRWRAAPREREHWFLVRPQGWDERAERGETGRVVLQVRLEPVGEADTQGERRVARSVKPIGAPAQRLIVDPVAPDRRSSVIETWPPGSRTRVTPGRTRSFNLGRGGGRPALEYWAPVASLGQEVTIQLGEADERTETVIATRGRWRLDETGRLGVRALRLDGPAAAQRGFRAMINRPPAGRGRDASLVRMKTVWRLSRRGLTVRVRTDGTRKTLNVLLYHPSNVDPPDVRVVATVDGGEPRRHARGFSRFTPAVRSYAVGPPRSARSPGFANVKGRTAGYPRLVAIGLGDDLTPGVHTIRVAVEGGTGWARFFTMESPGAGGSGKSERATSFRAKGERTP